MQKKGRATSTLSGARDIDVRTFAHAVMDGEANSSELDARALELYDHYQIDEDELIRDVYPHLLIAAQFCQCRRVEQSGDDNIQTVELSADDQTLIISLLEEKGLETIASIQHCSGALKGALQEKAGRIETALSKFN